MKPIVDRAEVSIDFPDKAYMGSFSRDARYEVAADPEGATIRLARRGGEERREVHVHLHWFLLADVIEGIADAVAAGVPIDPAHGETLARSAARLQAALAGSQAGKGTR